jgi:hypothetical protein
VHFLTESEHPSLLALIWMYGAPVVGLAAAWLLLALWRNGVRFGSIVGTAPAARRSLAEQIRGTGQFALRFGGGIDQVMVALLAGATCCSRACPASARPCWCARCRGAGLRARARAVHARPDAQRHQRARGVRPKLERFAVRRGPGVHQLLLADEINRAPAKTQSALLEAMQEARSPSRAQLPAAAAVHVLATQNPVEQEGTYPLPEAQLDRFLLKIKMATRAPWAPARAARWHWCGARARRRCWTVVASSLPTMCGAWHCRPCAIAWRCRPTRSWKAAMSTIC